MIVWIDDLPAIEVVGLAYCPNCQKFGAQTLPRLHP